MRQRAATLTFLHPTTNNQDNIINVFEGKYRFLSNFYPAPTQFEGVIYPSAEHAYVAAKTDDPAIRKIVALQETAGKVKRLGQGFPVKKDWEYIKYGIMKTIVTDKFFRNPELALELIETYPMHLTEGNWWGDIYWGICEGKGANHLGKILMKVREELFLTGKYNERE